MDGVAGGKPRAERKRKGEANRAGGGAPPLGGRSIGLTPRSDVVALGGRLGPRAQWPSPQRVEPDLSAPSQAAQLRPSGPKAIWGEVKGAL